jgi:mono/diheme cytochrome c family protein
VRPWPWSKKFVANFEPFQGFFREKPSLIMVAAWIFPLRCGSCHGMTLRGGLGPALLPDALAKQPAEALVATILDGRPGTAMPGWSRFMSVAEAEWIAARLQTGFPPLPRQ